MSVDSTEEPESSRTVKLVEPPREEKSTRTIRVLETEKEKVLVHSKTLSMSGIKGAITIAPELEEEQPDQTMVETEAKSFSGLEEIVLGDIHHIHDI